MDHEIKMEPYDPATNSVMATCITRLTEAEEARWREMLAEAWDEGYRAGTHGLNLWPSDRDIPNPYRHAD